MMRQSLVQTDGQYLSLASLGAMRYNHYGSTDEGKTVSEEDLPDSSVSTFGNFISSDYLTLGSSSSNSHVTMSVCANGSPYNLKPGMLHASFHSIRRLVLSTVILQYGHENEEIWAYGVSAALFFLSSIYDVLLASSWVEKKTKPQKPTVIEVSIHSELAGLFNFSLFVLGALSSSIFFSIAEMSVVYPMFDSLPGSITYLTLSLCGRLTEEMEKIVIAKTAVCIDRSEKQGCPQTIATMDWKIIRLGLKMQAIRRYYSFFRILTSVILSIAVTQFFEYNNEVFWRTVFVSSVLFTSCLSLLLDNYRNNALNRYNQDKTTGWGSCIKHCLNLFFLSKITEGATSINTASCLKKRGWVITVLFLLISAGLGATSLCLSLGMISLPNNSTTRLSDRLYLDEALLLGSLLFGFSAIFSLVQSYSTRSLSIASSSVFDNMISTCVLLKAIQSFFPDIEKLDSISLTSFLVTFLLLSLSTSYVPYHYNRVISNNALSNYSILSKKEDVAMVELREQDLDF
jgi:hypothetical protein